VYNNKGIAYSGKNDHVRARRYFEQALLYARKYPKAQSEIAALVNIGASYIESGYPAEAIPYLQTVLNTSKGINPYYKEINTLYLLGVAYFRLGDYTRADKNFHRALDRSVELGIPEFMVAAHKQLAELYDQTEDFHQAFVHQRAYINLKDSIITKEKSAEINQLEVKYRTTQKDKELVENKLKIKEQERQITKQTVWITGIGLGALSSVVLLISLYQKYRNRQRLQAKQILILTQEQEIGRLKAMMDGEEKERRRLSRELHDCIGGTLAAVKLNFELVQKQFQFLRQTDSFSEAMMLLDTMSSELREAAHNLMPESILQHGLEEAVRRYCEQITKSRNITVDFQSYGTFDRLGSDIVLIAYRIIQEVLHNIIKHAHATHAIIQLNHHDNLLSISFEDNGIGFDPEEDTGGMGLKNLRTRVSRMNGKIIIESRRASPAAKGPSPDSGTDIYVEFELSPESHG
jgi:two-component system NarL family sensor kinase